MATGIDEHAAVFNYFSLKGVTQPMTSEPPEALADHELMEAMLAFTMPRHLVKDTVRELLSRFGSMGAVAAAPAARLKRECDLGDDAIFILRGMQQFMERTLREQIKDRPMISSWTSLIDYLSVSLQHEQKEQFRVLFLDRKNILIRDELLGLGTVDHAPLYPREIIQRSLELGASAVILVHNHPSGDPTPSSTDIDMTRKVDEALKAAGITLHDHIVVGKNRHTSFRTQQLIPGM